MSEIEAITGRYLRLEIEGRAQRLYFEEAGSGIPLVCLHTAGADGRQFRHLMLDSAVTDHYRVIAFDLPWHGKSNPPAGWQDEEYTLSSAAYVACIRAFSAALALERPVVMGCSIGGRIVLHLAADHGPEFRALIGLEAAAEQTPWYDTDWLDRADVHGGEISAALVSGLIAPQAPDEARHETLWAYKISGPGIFKGDLHSYRSERGLADRLGAIDPRATPLYLLTGEYDFSCAPEDTARTAAAIGGVEPVVMKGLGHFPMSEHPERFRDYILPVLDDIRARG